MPLFKKSNILFIHIPKTAGTSIEKQLYDLEDPSDRWTNESFFTSASGTYYHGRVYSLQHYTFKDFEEIIGQDKLNSFRTIFAIVRNPYERMVSEFYYYHRYVLGHDVVYTDVSDLQQQFEAFCRKLIEGQLKDDNHHLPQYAYLVNNTENIDTRIKILRYETLSMDIKNHLGLDLAYHALKSERTINYKDHYNVVCQQLVGEYYSHDFTLFYYDHNHLP